MDSKAITEQLRIRLNNDRAYFKGQIPERYAIAWHGYLLAVVEWGVIDQGQCDELLRLLPKVEDDPSIAIALGREDPDEADD